MDIMIVNESRFLSLLFAEFEKQEIRYAVLRNAECLPESLNGGDIDIFVARSDCMRAQMTMTQVAKQCGGCITGKMTAPHFVQTEMMGCVDGVWWGCCIDLFDGIFVKSVLPIAGEELLSRRVDNGRGVWTLPTDLANYLGFVKELLVAGKWSSRYEEGAKRTVKTGADDVLVSSLCRAFVRQALVGDMTSVRGFVRSWLIKMAMCHPIYFWKHWFGFMASRALRYVRPSGKMIVVLGTDGSGKSTLLNEVLPLLQTMTHGSTVVHHLKPDFLPPLGRFRGVKQEPGQVCRNPHGSRPSGVIGSFFRLVYLTVDYVLGYWLRVRVKVAKTPIGYWIFDRYAFDLLLDPRRFRIALPSWVIRAFIGLVPKPDIVFCLGGDPEKIFARKPETSIKEVCRQVEALHAFAETHPNSVWIDTTRPLEESADEFLRGLMK